MFCKEMHDKLARSGLLGYKQVTFFSRDNFSSYERGLMSSTPTLLPVECVHPLI